MQVTNFAGVQTLGIEQGRDVPNKQYHSKTVPVADGTSI